MQGEHSSQNSFFGMIYEELVPADHLLRKLAAKVDLFRLPQPPPETPAAQAPGHLQGNVALFEMPGESPTNQQEGGR